MKTKFSKIKAIILITIFLTLYIFRFTNPFPWASSIAVIGLIMSFFDIITDIWHNNKAEDIKKDGLYLFCLLSFLILIIILVVLVVANIISPRTWMENSFFVDEITIIALAVCIFQESIKTFLNNVIQGNK